MLSIFGCKDSDPQMCKQLGIKWCTNFKLLGLVFDQTLEDMNSNYDLAKKNFLLLQKVGASGMCQSTGKYV